MTHHNQWLARNKINLIELCYDMSPSHCYMQNQMDLCIRIDKFDSLFIEPEPGVT